MQDPRDQDRINLGLRHKQGRQKFDEEAHLGGLPQSLLAPGLA
jgi:hypothetical protein